MPFLVTILASHLAGALLELIRIAVPITTVRGIDDVDSKDKGGALSSLFLVSIAAVFLFLLSSLGVSFF